MRLTPERRQQVLAAYVSGMPLKEIKRKFGVGHSTVHNIRLANGVNLRTRPRSAWRVPDELREKIADAYRKGMPRPEISETFGVAHSFVDQIRDEYNLAKRPTGNRIPLRTRRQIADDYTKQIPVRRICEKFGVTDGTVNKIRREFGLPPRVVKAKPKPPEREHNWFDIPPWKRFESVIMGHNRNVYGEDHIGPDPVSMPRFSR